MYSIMQQRLCLTTILIVSTLCAIARPGVADASSPAVDLPPALTIDTMLHHMPVEHRDHTTPAETTDTVSAKEGAIGGWLAVESHLLDDMRGGFDTPLNLTLSFGIERAVYLNGALVTTTSFNLPALGGIMRDDASGQATPVSSVALLQNGSGNTFVTPTIAPLAATVIQNTLNNQTIQNLTTINASANSPQLLRNNFLQSLIRDSIGNAAVPH